MIQRQALLALIGFNLILVQSSFAVQSIDVQTYNPSTSDHFVLIEDAMRTEWPKMGLYYFGAQYNYDHQPFSVTDATISQNPAVIDNIQTVDLMFGYKPDRQLGLYFGLPIDFVTYSPGNVLGASGTSTAIGDAKIMAKIKLNREDENTTFALIPEFHLPTGNTQNFVSDASTYLALRAVVERIFQSFTLGINVGYAYAPNSTYTYYSPTQGVLPSTLDFRQRILLGIGGFLPFNDTWGMSIEFNSQIPVPFNSTLNPNELYGGIRYAAMDGLIFNAGATLAKIAGPSGQDFRAIVGVKYILFDSVTDNRPKPVYVPPPTDPTPTPSPVAQASPSPAIAPAPMTVPAPKNLEPVPVPTAAPLAPPVAQAQGPGKNVGGKYAVLKGRKIELLIPVNFDNGRDHLTLEAK